MASVGRKLRIAARIARGGELHRRLASQVIEPQLALRIENQVLRIRSPQVRRHVIAGQPFFLALVLHLVDVRIERRQLRRADQYLLLAGGRVHVPQFALLSLLVALHERELGAVRTPLHRLGTASRQPAGLKHAFNGQRLGWRSLRCRRNGQHDTNGEYEQGTAQDEQVLSFHEVTSQRRNDYQAYPRRTNECTPARVRSQVSGAAAACVDLSQSDRG